MDRVLANDLLDKLKYIKHSFAKSGINYNVYSRKPIYLYRLLIRETIDDFERDINTDKLIIKLNINSILTFGESPEEAKNHCKIIMEDLKNKLHLGKDIQYDDFPPELISPWD